MATPACSAMTTTASSAMATTALSSAMATTARTRRWATAQCTSTCRWVVARAARSLRLGLISRYH
eukprot:5730462-Alexandrium_andersonii.AAC.1